MAVHTGTFRGFYEFFEAVAQWGVDRSVVVTFERDEYDGWYARMHFRDTTGPYSGVLNLVPYVVKRKKDEHDHNGELKAYRAQIYELLSASAASAHSKRHRPAGLNVGHGHVYPRPDGMRARCGGPSLCAQCALDKNRKEYERGV